MHGGAGDRSQFGRVAAHVVAGWVIPVGARILLGGAGAAAASEVAPAGPGPTGGPVTTPGRP
jgi:hypothetical protein